MILWFRRNPRAVAKSVRPVWESLPRRQYCRRGRNSQPDWSTARGFRQNPKYLSGGRLRNLPFRRISGFWRNPREVSQSAWSVCEFLPRRQYCRRGRNPQTEWANARGFRQNPKDRPEENSELALPNDFRALAKSAGSRPVSLGSLGISAPPAILPARQKSPD